MSCAALAGNVGMLPAAFGGAATGTVQQQILIPNSLDGTDGCNPLTQNVTDEGAPLQGAYLMLYSSGACPVATQVTFSP